MRVLIVDDEPLALEILESYILKTPGLRLVGKCSNALEAFSVLARQDMDLLMLDINMPEISGVDFLKSIKNAPPVIFTTAYPEFALTGYDLDVIDYLLKPIPFERFLKAVQKAQNLVSKAAITAVATTEPGQSPMPFVRAEGRLIRVDIKDLALVEGLKDYVRLWTGDARIVVHSTMKGMEESLVAYSSFLRISKSSIVNLAHITSVDGNCMTVKGQLLTIGTTYREKVMEVIGRFKLL